jgi:hypothetical protein
MLNDFMFAGLGFVVGFICAHAWIYVVLERGLKKEDKEWEKQLEKEGVGK